MRMHDGTHFGGVTMVAGRIASGVGQVDYADATKPLAYDTRQGFTLPARPF